MDYVYDSTLASTELRLLQPLTLTNDILRFKTRRVQRTSKPRYTAVSYTWGDADASEVIYLDNQRFLVRPNLWSCLRYVGQNSSSISRLGEWEYLWVDAICINQASDAERNSQVELMDQTYKYAVCVSVWLGLMKLPDYILDGLSTVHSQTPIKTIESDGFDWMDEVVEQSNRPYWSRVWVIQEFLLGKSVELYCSNNRIGWQSFQELLGREAGINQFYDVNDNVPQGDQNRVSLSALSLVMGRHMDKHPEYFQPLCNLLIDHHKSTCKDPRDRVFALLGLITVDERNWLNKIFPNYSITRDHVLIITLAHLTQFPALSRMERNGENITPDSEELFLGLGVKLNSERRRLLRRAKEIDYLGLSPEELLQSLSSRDQLEEYECESTYEQQDVSEIERPRRHSGNLVIISSVFVSLGYAIWWYAKRKLTI